MLRVPPGSSREGRGPGAKRVEPALAQALDRRLTGERRRRAVIQMANSLRNLGRPEESVKLLSEEMDARAPGRQQQAGAQFDHIPAL